MQITGLPILKQNTHGHSEGLDVLSHYYFTDSAAKYCKPSDIQHAWCCSFTYNTHLLLLFKLKNA